MTIQAEIIEKAGFLQFGIRFAMVKNFSGRTWRSIFSVPAEICQRRSLVSLRFPPRRHRPHRLDRLK